MGTFSGLVVAIGLLLYATAHASPAATTSSTAQCLASQPCDLTCSTACSTALPSAQASSPAEEQAADARLVAGSITTGTGSTMQDLISRVTAVAEKQALAATARLGPLDYPEATLPNGTWELVQPGHWTSGFFPGVLWQLHALTGKQSWLVKARQWQAGLADQQLDWSAQHDLGFIYLPTYAHSFDVTNNTEDKRQALAAAEALAWAYNPATQSLRTFEGWQPPGATHFLKQIVIIDFMINIHLLTWASKHVGKPQDLRMFTDPKKTYVDMAISHARQVAANHVRQDGSTYHIVEYQPIDGTVNKRYQYQGYQDNSTWARGQSWGVLGFAWMYNETGMPEFLEMAQKVTDAWLRLLSEQEGTAQGDFIPKWDFNAPYIAAIDGPRDTSAAAVAALGMLHLSESLSLLAGRADCARKYMCAAVNTLRALGSKKYLAAPSGEAGSFPAVLRHGTGNLPVNKQIDVGIIYGDYYYLVALNKCRAMEACVSHPI